jgi:hypothetical protein
MKHFSERGRIYKSVKVKVFGIGNTTATTRVLRSSAGKGFSSEGVDEMLDAVAADLEHRFPDDEYSLVPLGETQFNFVWRGRRV